MEIIRKLLFTAAAGAATGLLVSAPAHACTQGDLTPVIWTGTAADEIMGGCDGDDTLDGQSGDDNIEGGDGNDRISGGKDRDFLFGEDGRDILTGGDGVDYLDGGDGLDRFDGGEGVDSIAFIAPDASEGAVADLARQTITNDGFGNREKMSSIEGVGGGTRYADDFQGDDGPNPFSIARGDRADGRGGDDHFAVADAPERIRGGAGVDFACVCSARLVTDANGADYYEDTTNSIEIDLALRRIVNDGWGGSGRIEGIEDISGRNGPDILRGDKLANAINGSNGDDRIYGNRGDDRLIGAYGADKLAGGAGADVFAYSPYWYDSGPDSPDAIDDFSQTERDKIDLSQMDANYSNTVDDPLAFVALETPDFVDGAVTWQREPANNRTLVRARSDWREFTIVLDGLIKLTASDFIF